MLRKRTMEYKGYIGSVEYSPEDEILYGQILGINAAASYEGKTMDELRTDFHDAVDSYLSLQKNSSKQSESDE